MMFWIFASFIGQFWLKTGFILQPYPPSLTKWMLNLLYLKFSLSDGFSAYLDFINLVPINYNEMQMLHPKENFRSIHQLSINDHC